MCVIFPDFSTFKGKVIDGIISSQGLSSDSRGISLDYYENGINVHHIDDFRSRYELNIKRKRKIIFSCLD